MPENRHELGGAPMRAWCSFSIETCVAPTPNCDFWGAPEFPAASLPCVRGAHVHHECALLPCQIATFGVPPALPCARCLFSSYMCDSPTPNDHFWNALECPGAPVRARCSFSTFPKELSLIGVMAVLMKPRGRCLLLAALGCSWFVSWFCHQQIDINKGVVRWYRNEVFLPIRESLVADLKGFLHTA
jgi:hypothetical protein